MMMNASIDTRHSQADVRRHANSFDQLRLLAALLVLVGHSYPITGNVAPQLLGRGLHALGLEMFFAISGYLIAESLIRDRHPLRFLAKRALRILPALWVATVVLLFFGLCFTTLTPVEYLTSTRTLSFLKNGALDIHYALPGVFEDNPFGPAINGSWWSLPNEVALYLALLACVTVARGLGVAVLIALYVVLFGTGFVENGPLSMVAGFFVAGATMSALKGYLKPSGLVALFILLAAALFHNYIPSWGMPALLTYCVISLGLEPDRAPRLGRVIGDPSYGTYLYAFAIQQAIVALVSDIDPTSLSLLAAPIAVLMGVLSWRIVEAPALERKPRKTLLPSIP